jgi:hypothetical protein
MIIWNSFVHRQCLYVRISAHILLLIWQIYLFLATWNTYEWRHASKIWRRAWNNRKSFIAWWKWRSIILFSITSSIYESLNYWKSAVYNSLFSDTFAVKSHREKYDDFYNEYALSCAIQRIIGELHWQLYW